MTCANCGKDFKEDPDEKGFYTQQNTHFGRPFRESGYVCGFCGFHNTIFQIPTKVQFTRSARTFNKLDAIVDKFRAEVEAFYNDKTKHRIQLDVFNESSIGKK